MKIAFVSLGCSKNLVVTEEIIGLFKKHHYEIVNDVKEAEIILINTCGFIDKAKDEGIQTILEMADYKNDQCKYLIVVGCLVERYKQELQELLPEVDLFLSISDYHELWLNIDKLVNKTKENDELSYKNRVLTTGTNYAYLKIAEGCSNYCTYCAIPYIQGRYISRPFEEIIDEAKMLEKQGIKELIVIAQDTTKYGLDLYGKVRLPELLNELCKLNFTWIRFLYSYPETITDELIEVVKKNDKICKYFDLPIQHISNNMLKRMNRKSDTESINNLIAKLRKEIPNVILRSTLIVGFPNETEEDFNELLEFVKEAKFDHLGAFAYSKEDGTPAAKFKNQIPAKTKEIRRKQIMVAQQINSRNNLHSKIGNIYKCLIEDVTPDGKYFIGRTYMDVPSEDGIVYVEFDATIALNDFVDIEITGSTEYDLIGGCYEIR